LRSIRKLNNTNIIESKGIDSKLNDLEESKLSDYEIWDHKENALVIQDSPPQTK